MKKTIIILTTILVSLSTTIFAQKNDASQKKINGSCSKSRHCTTCENATSQKKTKGYIVFAIGKNTISNSQKEIYDNLDMGKSRSYEIGYARNTRLSEKSNLLHLNYGLSLVYNNIRIKNGYTFKQGVTEVLAAHSSEVNGARLRNSYLQTPVYLELDFTSDKKLANPNKISKKGFKIGVGGFMGFKLNTKQFVDYKDGKEVTYKDFKTNNFTYGFGTYVGYSFASFYVKYDLREMFEHNANNNPHNVSFGLRFDI